MTMAGKPLPAKNGRDHCFKALASAFPAGLPSRSIS
jgi:hypothetical protein